MDKNKVYDKYKWLGIITLFPLSVIGYFSLYFFQFFFKHLSRSNFPEDFDWRTNMGLERILGILFFSILFLTILSAFLSSISFWVAGHKKDEKWLRRAQNFRIIPWIILILLGIILVGAFSSQILYRF